MEEKLSDKRKAVLKATLELISEHGFHGTPMSQIANRANVGVGTIYRYFTDKKDLINALYIDTKSNVTLYTFQSIPENIPVQEGFKLFFSNIIHYYMNNPNELSFAEQYENSPLITSDTREKGSRIADPVNKLFTQALEQGLLKEMSFEMLGALISGSIISLAKLYTSGMLEYKEESLNKGLNAIWDMIRR